MQVGKEKLPLIFFIDSTGSVVEEYGKRVYLYSLCANSPLPNTKCFPLLEWISNAHDTSTISWVISKWRAGAKSSLRQPHILVSDMSFAILNAAALSFNSCSLRDQLNIQWQNVKKEEEASFTILRLCANHFMHLVARKAYAINSNKNVYFLIAIVKYLCENF